jgi:two-component system, cell cycle sensor histidine kinase and response regulator CckA
MKSSIYGEEETEGADETPMSNERKASTPARILVCEDKGLIADDLGGILRSLDYEVAELVSTGEEAVQRAEVVKPDLVLMEIEVKGGIDAAEQICTRFDIPVVYLTGYTEEDLLERAEKTFAYGFLARTGTALELKTTIEAALYKHAADKRTRGRERTYRTITETANIGIFTSSLDGAFIQANPAVAKMTGYASVDEFLAIRAEDLYANVVDRHRFVDDLLRKGAVTDYEVLGHTKDGRAQWISLKAVLQKDHMGNPVSILGIAEDITCRKIAEEALKESEEKYRLIFSREKDAIVLTDAETNTFLEVNESAEQLWGYSREELLEMKAPDVSAEPEESKQALSSGAGTEGIQVPIRWHKKKDGTVFPVEISAGPFTWKGRSVVCSIIRDSSERLACDRALRESQVFLESTVDALPAHIAILDENGTILAVNETWRRFGRNNDVRLARDGVGVNYLEICDSAQGDWSEGAPQVAAMIREVIAGQRNECRMEYPCHSPSEKRWFTLHVTRFLMGEHVRVVLAHENITERKMAEEAQRESERLFRTIFDQAAVGVAQIISRTGQFVKINKKLIDIGGYTREELQGMTLQEITHPEDVQRYMSNLELLVEGRIREFSMEKRLYRKGGAMVWVNMTVSPMWDLAEAPNYHIVAVEDITERKRAQEEAQNQASLMKSLLEAIPAPVFYKDAHHVYIGCNDSFAVLLGLPKENIIGKSVFDIAPKELAEVYKKQDEALLQSPGSQIYEAKVKSIDGSIRHAMFHKASFTDASGAVAGLIGVTLDITERKKAEEALREGEERYRLLFDNMLEGAAYCKMLYQDGRPYDFVYLDVNESFEKLTGLTHVAGKKVTEVIPGIKESNPELFEIYGRVALTGNPERFETYIRSLGIWFSVSVYSTQRGYFAAVFDNISHRKRSEQELKEAKDYLDRIINSIADPVFVKNEDHEWVLLNHAYCTLMGYASEELIGKSDYDFFPSSEGDVFWEKDEIVFRTGRENTNTETFTDRDGVAHTIVTKKSRYVDPVGKKYLVGVIRDITESEKAEADRRKLEHQLQQAQKMEAIGTLAGGIAHDFNNLLQITLGYSELLLAEKADNHPDYADLQKIYRAACSGAELVRSLLTFSRKVEPRLAPLSLNEQVKQVEKLLKRTIPKMIDIRLELAKDIRRIYADATQIDQIIMNLALNARDAMGEDGALTIRTENVTLDEEYCQHNLEAKPGPHVLLSVSDNGHGMAPETVQHIFEPFFTTKEVGRGTGLGLAMVYGIVKQHGGHITCSSEIGRGASFQIYLPAITEEIEPEMEPSGDIPASGNETVLVVDDEDLVRELAQRILTKSGYTVLTATNGAEALDLYRREKDRISLVILDLIMPMMGGKYCLKRLLEIDPHVKVLIASGYSADTSTKEILEMAARGFVSKPFTFTNLLRQVRKVLDET